MKNKNTIIFIIVAIIIAGGAFYGGIIYQKNQVPAAGNFRNLQAGGANRVLGQDSNLAGRAAQGGFISGEILNKDDKSLTLKLRDGGSKIIFFSDTTKVSKSTDGSNEDLVQGKEVMINGTTNADGSINAQTITLGVMPFNQPASTQNQNQTAPTNQP